MEIDQRSGTGRGDAGRAGRNDAGLLLAALAGGAGALLLLGAGLVLGDRTPAVDNWGLAALRLPPGSPGETAVHVASEALLIISVAAAAAAAGALLRYGWRRTWPAAAGAVLLFLLLAPTSELLKPVFGRVHPSDPTEHAFPSTHVTMVTVAVVIAAAIGWRLAPRQRAGLVVIAFVLVAGTAATRVLLGEHHLTDVTVTALGYTGITLLGVRLLPLPRI